MLATVMSARNSLQLSLEEANSNNIRSSLQTRFLSHFLNKVLGRLGSSVPQGESDITQFLINFFEGHWFYSWFEGMSHESVAGQSSLPFPNEISDDYLNLILDQMAADYGSPSVDVFLELVCATFQNSVERARFVEMDSFANSVVVVEVGDGVGRIRIRLADVLHEIKLANV